MDKHRTATAWLQTGQALPIASDVSRAFDDYVNALPWAGTTGLDWSRLPASRELNLVGKSPTEVFQWIKTTRLGGHSHIAVWYSPDEGGIIVPMRAGAMALDELYLHAPGPRFLFGVDLADGLVRPYYSDFIQYGVGDLLIASS